MKNFDLMSSREVALNLKNAEEDVRNKKYSSLDDAFGEILGENWFWMPSSESSAIFIFL